MFEKNMAVPAILVFMFSPEFSKGLINSSEQSHLTDNSLPNVMTGDRTGRTLFKECENGSINPKCLKIHALSWIEDISSRNELPLLPGLSIVKENQTNKSTTEEIAAELSRKFPGNPEEKLNRFLMYRLKDYLDGHSLKYKLADQQTEEESNAMVKGDTSVETARGKGGGGGGGGFGGGKGGGGGFAAAALMMGGTAVAAAIAALAALAGKALMTALMSLLLSALIGMKGHGGGGKTHYEIITKPEVSHHHTHSKEEHHEHAHDGHHGGYRRAYDPVIYNSYMPYDTASYPNTTS